jgi:hypothetical protein
MIPSVEGEGFQVPNKKTLGNTGMALRNSDKVHSLEQQLELLKAELQQYKEANQILQQQYQTLKLQNERMLKKEAEHQSAKNHLLHKRIIMSRAIVLVPENLVIGDRLENCTIKVYRGTNVVLTDTAELINCRIIGLDHAADGKTVAPGKHPGTIEIKGVFYNMTPRKFGIATYERVIISPGARVVGNILAERIVINELTKIRGRFASLDLIRKKRELKDSKEREENEFDEQTKPQDNQIENVLNDSKESYQVTEIG